MISFWMSRKGRFVYLSSFVFLPGFGLTISEVKEWFYQTLITIHEEKTRKVVVEDLLERAVLVECPIFTELLSALECDIGDMIHIMLPVLEPEYI